MLRLNTHAPYVCGFKWRDTVSWCMVVWCTQNVRRDCSSFKWHQPCNNQIALRWIVNKGSREITLSIVWYSCCHCYDLCIVTLSREVMNKQALISVMAASCCLCVSVSPTSPRTIHTLSHTDEASTVKNTPFQWIFKKREREREFFLNNNAL